MDEPVPGVIEPVHWGSRLVRAEDLAYTEVAGTPVLVPADGAPVQVLTPAWAAVWAQLDGRPITDSLAVDPAALDPVDARNLIEVLRRLKAEGVVRDAEPDAGSRDPGELEAVPVRAGRVAVRLGGSVVVDPTGVTLRIIAGNPARVTVELSETAVGVAVTVRRRFRRRVIDRVEVADPNASRDDALGRFSSILAALDDRDPGATPGLVDLLAGVAERAVAPGSPPS